MKYNYDERVRECVLLYFNERGPEWLSRMVYFVHLTVIFNIICIIGIHYLRCIFFISVPKNFIRRY